MQFIVDTDKIAHGNILEVDADHKWGRELRLVNGIYCGKLLELTEPRVYGSLHHHKNKTESFVILSGNVEIYCPDSHCTKAIYSPGHVLTLKPGQKHQFRAIGHPALLLEVSTPHSDSDTYRT